MTNRAVFASLVERVFGSGAATFDVSVAQSNNVIGALAHATEFSAFKKNFEARLRRLNSAVMTEPNLRPEVLSAVNRIVDAGWDGAYAELSALDYFLADEATGPGKLALDQTVPATETLASEMGMQNANHDLTFPDLGVSLDTKLLSDKTGEILEGIFKDYRASKGIKNLLIVPSYDLDGDFIQYSKNRKALLDELINKVDVSAQPRSLTSEVVPGLSYTFAWRPGVYIGESSYSPEEHAKNHHPLLFGHAKKFSRNRPTIIVFVLFPWSGEKVFPFEDAKRTFLQRFGNHFFKDYVGSSDPASMYNKKFKTGMKAGEATRHLSGLIFLEDEAITAAEQDGLNVHASYHWNPNAIHSLAGHDFEAVLIRRRAFDLNAFSQG